ncbi:aminopeptidase [Myxococcota bacterium]|nr:aminopeptidase [Myxococcota bacterium]MBU1429830.1 aminopeptidase [Myxococcota bacterium]MBU1898407.1 aminopeptidase [Myxococcota bacterium]
MRDPRHAQLAALLAGYATEIKPGERVLIEAYDTPTEFLEALVKAVYAAGGHPVLEIKQQQLQRALLMGASEASLSVIRDAELHRMKLMNVFIGVRGLTNASELIDLPEGRMGLFSAQWMQPVHMEQRLNHTRWVVLRYPTPFMAMKAKMSTEAFEDFYYDVTSRVDYARMSKAMDPAKAFLEQADRVHILGPGTDLKFSIKGIGATKCDGHLNIPDGEIYSCPVRDSVEGFITYNTPSSYHSFTFNDIKLRFERGRIVEATANDTARINAIFDTDEGARYIGEFALGCNPQITQPMDDILFDEKIMGSFHFTPGNAYDDTDNGNRSAVHWDLVCIQTPEYGGGEIWIDGALIRKDGIFVHPAFEGLNPDKLSL